MADLPQPLSYDQILANMLSSYAASLGIDDFNVGSAVTSFFEVVALTTARASGDVFQILRDFSIDRATGDALQRLAIEDGVIPITSTPATGFISVIDTSFTKISTKIYAGLNSPNIGSTSINASDASLFPATGSIYIGRGTPDIEGPLPYGSITPPGSPGGFYVINLSVPTTKYHNVGETIILAQGGNRSVPANTIVVSPSVGSTSNIQYSTTAQAIILDGETEVDNVPISALVPGSAGNVPIGAIKQFASPPFAGATVNNPLPLTNGADSETDQQLRVRIKLQLASIGLGTATAVENAVIGATATVPSGSQDTIVSASILSTTTNATLYIDDGTGYEATTQGVGIESIVDSALGGEQFFQLATGGTQAPVAKAFLLSTLSAPFDLIGGDTLAIVVGNTTYQHVFANSDFLSPGGATAYEVTASINADTSLGFEAVTSGGGIFVVLRAKAESFDSLQTTTPTTTGRDASVLMGMPSSQVQTLRLYKNNIPLSKDGNPAFVLTQNQQFWSPLIANGATLVLSVDGTAPITYTFLDSDFIATGLYTSVSSSNSLASWVEVFNSKLTGVTASIVGTQIEITSNLGASDRASVVIGPSSTLLTDEMFSASLGLSSTGQVSDFTLDRNTAQFELVVPLVPGDQLSAGSLNTQARIQSQEIPASAITLTSDGHVWILIDNPGTIIPTGVIGNTLLTVSTPSTNVVRYTSTVAMAFSNVLAGDYVIIWSNELAAPNRIEGRVFATTNTTLDILITPAEWAAIVPQADILFSAGFVVLRSTLAPQKFKVAAGTYTLDAIVQTLQPQTPSLVFSVLDEEFLIVRTVTKDTTGALLIVTADAQGVLLNFTNGASSVSQTSLIAYYDSQYKEDQFPLFVQAMFASGTSANPIDSFITSFVSSINFSSRDPNELISILHPYGTVRDAQPYGEYVQESSISGTTINIVNESDMRRFRGPSVDRFFIASPLDFGNQDTAIAVVDNNPSAETFTLPFYRDALPNKSLSVNSSNFNAYDLDSSPTANFVSAFGATFSFANYKVLMQAKRVLKPTPSQTAILYRSTPWGRSGQYVNVGYVYPSSPNNAINSTVAVGSTVDIRISLASGNPITTSIDSTTQWNVTIASNTPSAGIDQVTYTWNGTGTNPGLSLSGGEYVNISNRSGFNPANTGVFMLSLFTPPTPTSFTVQTPTGQAVAQSNVPTLVNNAIIFYMASPTTAAQVQAYVTANLEQYITATLVNDGGTSGSGIIVLSTYEDSGFTEQSVFLEDGINWIAYSNLSNNTVIANGSTSNGSNILVDVYPISDVRIGASVSGPGIQGGSVVNSISGNNIIISLPATATAPSTGFTIINTGTPQFVFKEPLSYPSDGPANAWYTFNNSNVTDNELIKLIPTTMVQVQQLLSVLAVTGFTTAGTVDLVDRGTRLELATDTVGSSGAIQIVGGLANQFEVPVLDSAERLDNIYMQIAANIIASQGILSDQWFRLQAATAQNKNTFFSSNTSVTLVSNDPIVGQTTVQMSGRTLTQRYFGKPRNNIRSQGDTFRIEKQGALVCLSWNPNIGANPTFVAPLSFNDSGGGTVSVALVANTDEAQYIIASGSTNFTELSIGDLITITGMSVSANNGTFLVTGVSSNGTTIQVLNPEAQTQTPSSFVAGNFSATSGVSEGDTFILSAPFNVLNQGKFRVIREYNNAIWFENPNVVEEEVSLPYNPVSLGFDATTSFTVNATNNTQLLTWNGIGTHPTLANANVGDIVTFGIDFASANQGAFMVLDSGPDQQEVTQFTMPSGSVFTPSAPGQYFTVWNAGNIIEYYVWFNVGTNTDPAPVGMTGIEVSILSSDSPTTVAAKAAIAIAAVGSSFTATSSGSILTVTTVGFNQTNSAANVNMPAPFSITVVEFGQVTFLEAINPSAVNQSSVFVVSGVLQDHRPQMQFYEYEATVPGDLFVVTGNVLTLPNAGSYTVFQVLNQNSAIITGTLASVMNVSLNGNENAVFVQEGVPYSGYKQVYLVAAQPGAPTQNDITFNTNAQYEKINQSASVELTSLNKIDYNTLVKNGLDSYSYNTGLIAEANRIVYGDPRDPLTYPGVGAAGADIFIREPLIRRVQVAIDVRLATGVPFAQTVNQVRSSVSSLVNANPVGQSIAISAIVSVVSAIPGILAVSISSPTYNVNNDLIILAPSEKAIIIDPTTDISVSQIGS